MSKDEPVRKHVDLGRSGNVVLHLSGDCKYLLVEFSVRPDGFDKAGLSAFIDALEKIRKKMER